MGRPANSNPLKDAEEAAKKLSDFVNPFGADYNTFTDQIVYKTHRTLQQSIGKVVFLLIRKWASMYHKDMYDLRNEHTCRVCNKIVKYMDSEDEFWDSPPTV